METTEDDNVINRLRNPSVRRTASITGLILQYLPEIQEARRNGKTWGMIGRDLRPENPIKADTARRTVERVRDRPKAPKARQRKVTKPTTPSAAQPQLALQSPPSPPNPFGRKVDPIRND